MKTRKARWFRFDPARHMAEVMRLRTNRAIAEYFTTLLDCLANHRKGVSEVADEMIEEIEGYFEERRMAGKIGAYRRYGHQQVSHSSPIGVPTVPIASTEQYSTEQEDLKSVGDAHARESLIPTVEEVKSHAVVIGMPEQDAVEFFEFWVGAEWKDKNGLPVRNWKAKLASRKNQNAERKAENANRERNGNQNRTSSAQHGRVTATGRGKW